MRELHPAITPTESKPVKRGIEMKNRVCETITEAIAYSIGIPQDEVTAHLEALEWDLLAYLDLITQWENERSARLATYVRNNGFYRFDPE